MKRIAMILIRDFPYKYPVFEQGQICVIMKVFFQTRSKPIIHMESGAGAVAGFHSNPSSMYTEEYLCDIIKEHFQVFDSLRQMENNYLVGEMIWNFADFATAQSSKRMFGNRKGLFTRDRNPKWPAYVVRDKYHDRRNFTSDQFDSKVGIHIF